MPLSLAVDVFLIGRRTFWHWNRVGTIRLETVMGASYVLLSTLRGHLGIPAYENRLKRALFNEETGTWSLLGGTELHGDGTDEPQGR